MKKIAYIAYTFLMLTACNQVTKNNPHAGDGNGKQKAADTTVHYIQEKHLTNVKQLTFGGDNAEAYWSYDGKSIIFIFFIRLNHIRIFPSARSAPRSPEIYQDNLAM